MSTIDHAATRLATLAPRNLHDRSVPASTAGARRFLSDYTPPPKVPNYENATARLARKEGYAVGYAAGSKSVDKAGLLAAGLFIGFVLAAACIYFGSKLMAGM